MNILKSSLRDFRKKPLLSAINLLGLAVSLALVIILSAYGYSELTTNHQNKNINNIYYFGEPGKISSTPGILRNQVIETVPEVEQYIRIVDTWEPQALKVDEQVPISSKLLYADSSFFDVFTFQAIQGDLSKALKQPMSLVLTKSLANQLFGSNAAIGKIVLLNNQHELTVTAVIEEPAINSSFNFKAISAMSTRRLTISAIDGEFGHQHNEFTNWDWWNFQTFLLLNENCNQKEVLSKIKAVIPSNRKEGYENYELVPLKDLYFSVSFNNTDFPLTGNKSKVFTLLAVGMLVLIIALVNFINISSAQWLGKIKQTGILKVIGAKRNAIILQVVIKSMLHFQLSLFIAFILVRLFAQPILNYTGINFDMHVIFQLKYILIAVLLAALLSALFSLIPAMQMSFSRALDNLRKNINHSSYKVTLRTGMVTLQFIIGITLIAFTFLVQQQVNFGMKQVSNNNIVLGIDLNMDLEPKKETLKNELLKSAYIKDVSLCGYFPGKGYSRWGLGFETDNGPAHYEFNTYEGDNAYINMCGLELTQGRLFNNTNEEAETGEVLINEKFIQEYEIENPLELYFHMDKKYNVVGVVKDFNYAPVNASIDPVVIRNGGHPSYCLVQLHSGNFNDIKSSIELVRKTSESLSPAFPVDIMFYNDAIANMYYSELSFRRSFTVFSGIAIVLSCLGILAMSLFAGQYRIKEIGVRKVNGAKSIEILSLINKDLLISVIIAFIIAAPIAWYFMTQWLNNYAYKTAITWWIFALSGLLALGIALLTVSIQTVRIARKNPVEALKYE